VERATTFDDAAFIDGFTLAMIAPWPREEALSLHHPGYVTS
jgi:hypothetical protein